MRILSLLALLLLLVGPAAAAPGRAKVFLKTDEALALAFPDAEIRKERIFLTPKQRKEAQELAKVEVENNMVYAYRAYRKGKYVGTAYFDAHLVRTFKETVMFAVGVDDTIQRFELLAFGEPIDYTPRGTWYAQFTGRKLDSDLSLKRGIRGVTGATLTAQATTDAARRVLALHEVTKSPASKPAPIARRTDG